MDRALRERQPPDVCDGLEGRSLWNVKVSSIVREKKCEVRNDPCSPRSVHGKIASHNAQYCCGSDRENRGISEAGIQETGPVIFSCEPWLDYEERQAHDHGPESF